jgi:hypothetical protein
MTSDDLTLSVGVVLTAVLSFIEIVASEMGGESLRRLLAGSSTSPASGLTLAILGGRIGCQRRNVYVIDPFLNAIQKKSTARVFGSRCKISI